MRDGQGRPRLGSPPMIHHIPHVLDSLTARSLDLMSIQAGRLVTILVAATLLVGGQANLLGAQEASHETHDEAHAANALALFVGGATHLGSDGHDSESGVAFGLEYARTIGSRLRIGALAEYASVAHEDDLVLAVPLFVHLTRNFLLVAAPGMERATIEEEGHEESETEFLMRFGTIYEIPFGNFAIGPQFYGDLVDGHWSLVYGLTFGVEF